MIDGIGDEVRRLEAEIARAGQGLAVLRAVGSMPEVRWAYVSIYGAKLEMSLEPAAGVEALEVVAALLGRLRLRLAKKEFDEASGQVRYVIDAPFATITVRGAAPARCEVVKEEVEVEVPARMEKRVKYRLVDPKCVGEVDAQGA